MLDTIDTKLYKPEQTKLKKKYLNIPDKSKNKDNNPTVTYHLGKMTRNKISNYKEAVNSICGGEDVSFFLNTDQCDCADSSFYLIINT